MGRSHQTHGGNFSIFQDGGCPVLDFQNVEILGVGMLKTAKVRDHAKFCGDWSNRC